jgi:predicted dehydrogenase
MEKLKTGLLGYGAVAHMHAKSLALCPEREFTGVYGPNPEKAKQFADQYGVRVFSSREELYAENDVIHICTPSGLHCSDTLDALAHNKHTMCEKPLCMTLEELAQIEKALEKTDAQLMPISQFRYSKAYATVKQGVEAGSFGKLLSANIKMMYYRSPEYYSSAPWRGTMAHDGGVIMNQSIHGVDVTLGWLGKPVCVTAVAKTMIHDIEAPDTVIALVEMENGATVIFETSTASFPGYPRRYCINGTNGAMEMHEETIIRWDIPKNPDGSPDIGTEVGFSGASDPMNIDASLHANQFTEFSRYLLHGELPSYSFADAKQTMRLIHAIFQSQKEDRKVYL